MGFSFPFTWKLTPLKIAAIKGVMKDETMALTRSVKAMLRLGVWAGGWGGRGGGDGRWVSGMGRGR